MTCYDMVKLSSELDFTEPFYVTRTNGEQAYPLIRKQLERLPQGQGLVLVFPKDQLIDVSFANETIIRLGEELMAGQFGDVTLLLQGLTEDSIKNIEAIIAHRRLKLGLLAVEPEGQWKCIGHLDPHLEEVLHILANRDQLTAPQLANLLNLAINTASNRLKRLYDRRLVRREYEVSARGLQYFYYFWRWPEDISA